MPDGDDSLSVPTEMVKELLFMEEADPDHKKVEAEYPVGDRDQAVADAFFKLAKKGPILKKVMNLGY